MNVGAGALAGRALRGGGASLAGLALVVALGIGASLGAAVTAHRTDQAWGDYVADAEVSELVINPSIKTAAMDEAIRGFDGVERARVDSLLFASVSITAPTTMAEGSDEDPWLQVRGSVDGRYIDLDRPAVHEGRVPSGEREVFVSTDYRSELERIQGRPLDVGDSIEVGFFWAGLLDADLPPDAVIEPLAVVELRISGFGVLPNEALPDRLFPRQQLIVSEDVTARYWCLPAIDDAAITTVEEAFAAFFPEDCAAQYDYWSLDLAAGTTPADIRRQFEAKAAELTAELPPVLAELGGGYFYISQERSERDAAVRETTRPAVIALRAFAVIAALATLTVVGLSVARQARRFVVAQRSLRAVGATRRQLGTWSAAPLLAAVGVGLVGAVLVALATSPLGPVGSVRSVAPDPGMALPASVLLPAVGVLALLLVGIVVAVVTRGAWVATRPERPLVPRAGRLGRLFGQGHPAVSTGVGAALDRRRTGAGIAAMLGCVVATAIATAAIVFGASLSSLVDDGAAFGWPWDVALITGGGYGDTDATFVEARLAEPDVRDDIDDASFFSFDPSIIFGDRPAPVVFGLDNAAGTELPVLEGRMATSYGEAVLGTDTATALGLEVGDQLTIDSIWYGELDIDVVGLAVLPSAGSFVADRTGLGTGAFILVDQSGDQGDPGLVGLQLRDGVDPDDLVRRLGDDLPSFSTKGEPPIVHVDPVRSPEIENVTELRNAPLVLGGVLLASLALGLWLAVTLSVRDRRHELAVLRVLGFSNGNLRRSVWAQGLTLVVAGLVVGVPLGVGLGRGAWRVFADGLGVLPATTVPLSWLALLVLVTVLLAWAAVVLPARSAARLTPAEELLVP